MATKPFDLSNVRNRISERRMLKPGELLDHPGQWREHTVAQAEAMAGILKEVGITDTLKAYISERAGGKLVTWDGHLRKSLDPDVEWPVDITDLSDAEADYALATHDPVGAMAGSDKAALDALLETVQTQDKGVQALLERLAAESGVFLGDPGHTEIDKTVREAIEEGRDDPRALNLDLIFTLNPGGYSSICCLAVKAGWAYGFQNMPCPAAEAMAGHKPIFIDNNYFAYDHAEHRARVKQWCPKYATVRDIMTPGQCQRANIPYYPLEQILEWAADLQQYAEKVIMIPKYDCLAKIPEQYVLGYSIPTSHGGTPLPIAAFRGRPIHLLGGSPGKQIAYWQQAPDDVVSIDNNYIMKAARYGEAFLADGRTANLTELGFDRVTSPLYVGDQPFVFCGLFSTPRFSS